MWDYFHVSLTHLVDDPDAEDSVVCPGSGFGYLSSTHPAYKFCDLSGPRTSHDELLAAIQADGWEPFAALRGYTAVAGSGEHEQPTVDLWFKRARTAG